MGARAAGRGTIAVISSLTVLAGLGGTGFGLVLVLLGFSHGVHRFVLNLGSAGVVCGGAAVAFGVAAWTFVYARPHDVSRRQAWVNGCTLSVLVQSGVPLVLIAMLAANGSEPGVRDWQLVATIPLGLSLVLAFTIRMLSREPP